MTTTTPARFRARPIRGLAALALAVAAVSSPASAQVLREYWTGLTDNSLASLTTAPAYLANNPAGRDLLTGGLRATGFDGGGYTGNLGDAYGQRLRGHLVAPTTGSYVFWIAADDTAEFRLSTDEKLANLPATPLCRVTSWVDQNSWARAEQKSAAVSLVAGKRYYFEVLHKEGNGGDHLAVGWTRPGQTVGSAPTEIIPNSVLEPALVPVLTAQGRASRFLQQATFGPRLAEIETLGAAETSPASTAHLSAWIDAQRALPATLVTPAYNAALAAANEGVTTPVFPQGSTVIDLIARNMLNGEDQLRQRVAYSLSQILVVSTRATIVNERPFGLSGYYDTLLKHAFGNFRDLLYDVTLHPIMGAYLSALNNQKADPVKGTDPDENYAREVMQLFSIGLYELNADGTQVLVGGQPVPTYTNAQITEFARVFTGLQLSPSIGVDPRYPTSNQYDTPMKMTQSRHDTGAKTLLAYPGSTAVTTSRGVRNLTQLSSGRPGLEDIADAVDNLFYHPNTPAFIGRLLIQRLTTSNPTDAYVGRVADAFRNNGQGVRGDLGAVVKAILLDPEARDVTRFADLEHGRKREPWQVYLHLIRSFRYDFTTVSNSTIESALGMLPMKAPSVFNFYLPEFLPPGPMTVAGIYGPEFQLHTAVLALQVPNRFKTSLETTSGVGKLDLSPQIALAGDVPALVDNVSLLLTGGALSPLARARIIDAVGRSTSTTDRARLAVYLVLFSADYNVLK